MNEEPRVLYGATLQIPFCIGSVALPLPYAAQLESAAAVEFGKAAATTSASGDLHTSAGATSPAPSTHSGTRKRTRSAGETGDDDAHASAGGPVSLRYTHRRYCYIRDGGDMAHDAFCRWLVHRTNAFAAAAEEATPSALSSSAPPLSDLVCGTVAAQTEAELMRLARDRPPSPFYAMVDKIEFIVPTSFPQPRRVVARPPFVIEDLCWAEHLVEVHVHFLPDLAIPPAVLLHQATLSRRVSDAPVPALTSATLDQLRVPPMVLSAYVPPPSAAKHKNEVDARRAALWHLVQAAVVAERKDTMRVLNPTAPVAAFARLVTDKMSEAGVVAPLRDYFLKHFYDEGCLEAQTSVGSVDSASAPGVMSGKDTVPVRLDAVPQYYTGLLCPQSRAAVQNPLEGDSVWSGQNNVAGNGGGDEDDDRTSWLTSPTWTSPLRAYHHPWDLPFEAAIYAYVTQRRRREAEDTMNAVVAQLRAEQEALVRQLRELVEERLPRSVVTLHEQLDASYQRCLALAQAAPTPPPAAGIKTETGGGNDAE